MHVNLINVLESILILAQSELDLFSTPFLLIYPSDIGYQKSSHFLRILQFYFNNIKPNHS